MSDRFTELAQAAQNVRSGKFDAMSADYMADILALKAERDALKAQRDELLAGLEQATTDLELAISAIQGLKVEAETAGAGGDEQMLQEACEAISNEGLAYQTKLYAAVKKARAAIARSTAPTPAMEGGGA